jgi:hypothetical protein
MNSGTGGRWGYCAGRVRSDMLILWHSIDDAPLPAHGFRRSSLHCADVICLCTAYWRLKQTADDWEMLELNQEYLIQNLLAQVNAITLDRPFPFFVRGNRLLLCATGASVAATRVGFARLANNSEVAIAPKVRRATALPASNAAAASSQVTHVTVVSLCEFQSYSLAVCYLKETHVFVRNVVADRQSGDVAAPRLILRLQPNSLGSHDGVDIHTAWVHPTTFRALGCPVKDPSVEASASLSAMVVVRSLSSALSSSSSSSASVSASSATAASSSPADVASDGIASPSTSMSDCPGPAVNVLRLGASESVAVGHVRLADATRQHMRFPVFTRLQVRHSCFYVSSVVVSGRLRPPIVTSAVSTLLPLSTRSCYLL